MLAMSVLIATRTAIRQHSEIAIMALVFLIISSLTTDVFNDISVGLILFLSIAVVGTKSSIQPTVNPQLVDA
jgi:hypothetical protein